MSSPTHLRRAGRACSALAVCAAFVALPAAAQAAAVDLGTAGSFVVLGGQAVTNTGPSVLDGDLGVSPGTSLTGFNAATVNGATHNNDAVAGQAQSDLTTAYGVAAGQPVLPGNVLTGQNLGNRTLTVGNYQYASSAGLTGQLTLDAQGDPTAQFVFEIGSTLTTASASSVVLINGASPCNVYWQVGSSATLGTTTAFQGNLMTLADISLNTGASVIGRVLAQTGGQITLDTNVLDNRSCRAGSTPPPPPPPPPGPTTGGGTTSGGSTTSGGASPTGSVPGQVVSQATPSSVTRNGTAIMRRAPHAACTAGFSATVRGRMINRVVFSLDGRRISSRTRSRFRSTFGPHPEGTRSGRASASRTPPAPRP